MLDSEKRFNFGSELSLIKFLANNLHQEIDINDRVQISKSVAKVIEYLILAHKNSFFLLDATLESFRKVRKYGIQELDFSRYLLENLGIVTGNPGIAEKISPDIYSALSKVYNSG